MYHVKSVNEDAKNKVYIPFDTNMKDALEIIYTTFSRQQNILSSTRENYEDNYNFYTYDIVVIRNLGLGGNEFTAKSIEHTLLPLFLNEIREELEPYFIEHKNKYTETLQVLEIISTQREKTEKYTKNTQINDDISLIMHSFAMDMLYFSRWSEFIDRSSSIYIRNKSYQQPPRECPVCYENEHTSLYAFLSPFECNHSICMMCHLSWKHRCNKQKQITCRCPLCRCESY